MPQWPISRDGAKRMSDDTGWVRAASRGHLGEGDVLGVVIGGKEIAIYDLDGTVYATDDICTHAYAKLSDGWLDKGEIECPLHAGPLRRADRQGDRAALHRRRQDLSGPDRRRRDSG